MEITYSVFPKFLKGLSVKELAALVTEIGFDTCNAIIREGYWTVPDDLTATLSSFVKQMREEGVEVYIATTNWTPEDIVNDPDILSKLVDGGIKEVRLTQLASGGGYGKVGDVHAELDNAKKLFEQTDELAERAGVRCIYQVHHQTLLPSASSVWPLLKNCSHENLGIMLDGGNQPIEGYERWMRSARLLNKYLIGFGIKDIRPQQDEAKADEPGKGWSWGWAPCYEGVTNWHQVKEALTDIDFAGIFIFMPFYYKDDLSKFKQTLKQEFEYICGIFGK